MIKVLRRVKRILKNILLLLDRSSIKAYWYERNHNFGDIINPLFIEKLSNKKAIWINPDMYPYKNYLIIGSILDRANKHSVVWGSGFISEKAQCREKPYKVCAVRGPLTREKLLESGIDCPEVYGDPALLLPKVYTPKTTKTYKLGIIAHYADNDNHWLTQINDSDILILDIQSPNPFDFIDQVNSCEKIASSSLHGLIVADAYGIPSLWLEFSDKVVGKGFKFLDYFASVKREDKEPIIVSKDTTINYLLNHFSTYEIDIDLYKLLDACPFRLTEVFQKNH